MAKTLGSKIVEQLLGNLAAGIAGEADNQVPMPRCAPDGEPITLRTIANRIDEEVDKDPRQTMQLALLLACLIARQQKMVEKDALMMAVAAWGQTSQLT
jgi:hypothetical protein